MFVFFFSPLFHYSIKIHNKFNVLQRKQEIIKKNQPNIASIVKYKTFRNYLLKML
jgi:hypothetical protein